MKPTKEQIDAYRAMAAQSPKTMKAQIEQHLAETCPKFIGNEDRLDDCIEYLTDCAREILNSKSGDVADDVCFKICRDYFNDELWKKDEAEKAEREAKDKEKAEKAEAKKAAAEAKKAAAEARKAEIARKKAEALAKKKAEEEAKKAELERMKAEAAREAEAMKAASMKPDPDQLDFFAIMGV